MCGFMCGGHFRCSARFGRTLAPGLPPCKNGNMVTWSVREPGGILSSSSRASLMALKSQFAQVLSDDPRDCWLADVVEARHLGATSILT
jgi:hypothetical protein